MLQLLIVLGAAGILLGAVLLVLEVRRVSELRRQLRQTASAKMLDFPSILGREDWASFEQNVPNLKQVIVVSDVVEEPHDGLRRAVTSNFSRGVRYSFLVSKSKASGEIEGYIQVFRLLARGAIQKARLQCKPEDLVQILALPDDWNNPPFVFYRAEGEIDHPDGRRRIRSTIAFRGSEPGVGIAESYEAVDPFAADALATALNSGAPRPIQEELQAVHEDTFLSFPSDGSRQMRERAN